jgi:hypothetical protein
MACAAASKKTVPTVTANAAMTNVTEPAATTATACGLALTDAASRGTADRKAPSPMAEVPAASRNSDVDLNS